MFWYGWSSKYLIHENEWRSCLGIGECVYRKHKETFPHFKALELKDGRQSWELQWMVSTFISQKRQKWGLIQCFGNFNECLAVNVVLFSIKLNKVKLQDCKLTFILMSAYLFCIYIIKSKSGFKYKSNKYWYKSSKICQKNTVSS